MNSHYHCNNCDTDFEHQDARNVRCPSCLRVNGIEPASSGEPKEKKPSPKRRRALLFGGLVLLLLCVVGGTALLIYRQSTDVPKPGQLAMLDAALLRQTLRRRGVPDNRVVDPFCSESSAVRSLAGDAGGGGVKQRVATLTKRLASKLQVVTRVKLTDIGDDRVRTAEQLAKRLAAKQADKKPLRTLSYELAVLVASAFRAAGIAALLCEAHELIDAPMRSADTHGGLGRFGVAVFADEDQLGGDPLTVLDPARAVGVPRWAGGKDAAMRSAFKACKPLDDGSAAAHLLSLRAQAAMRRSPTKENASAYELSALALKAAEPSPTLLVGRAMVLAGAGGTKDALAAMQRARQLRADAPRLTAAARMQLVHGDPLVGERLLQRAIKKEPKFWPARLMLATTAWLRGKKDEGDKHLEITQQVAAKEPAVLGGQADRLAFEGKHDEAIKVLRQAVDADPLDPQPLLLKLYLSLLRQGQSEQAKPIREKLVAVATDKQQMKRALEAIDRQAEQAAAASKDGQAPSTDAPPPPMPKLPKLKLPDVKL